MLLRIGAQDPILIILPEWLELILSGKKTLEIRSKACTSKVGKRVWLCASGTGMVIGMATVKGSRKLSAHEWESTRDQHHVPGGRFYGDDTHAWELAGAQRIAPTAIVRKKGSVVWQIGPGMTTSSPAITRISGHWCLRCPGRSKAEHAWRHGDAPWL